MTTSNGAGRPPRIVAELGRPETAAETAARKAENSRAHRANQTTRNLVLALLASLAVVLVTVLIVIRPDSAPTQYVNYRAVAKTAQPDMTVPLAVPNLPANWKANDAELKSGDDGNSTWYIGLITPQQQFIAIEEGVIAKAGWLGSIIGKEKSTGHLSVDGVRWTVYNRTASGTTGNFQYSLYARINSVPYVLHGTTPVSRGDAQIGEFRQVATGVIESVTKVSQ